MTRHPIQHRRVVARPLAAAIAVGLVYGQSAFAASIVVNVATDTSNAAECSLRDALIAARDNVATNGCAAGESANPDTVTFSLPNPSTITLSSSLPQLGSALAPGQDLNVQGPGAASLVVEIGNVMSGFDTFFGSNAPNLVVEGLTLRSVGSAVNAIRSASLTTRVATIRNTVFEGSFAETVSIFGANLLVENCSFTPSTGRGITASGISGAGAFVIRGSTFAGQGLAVNGSSGFGGTTTLTIENSTFDGNTVPVTPLPADVRAFGYGGTLTLNLRNTTLTSDAGTGPSVVLETSAFSAGNVVANVDSALMFRPSGTNIDTLLGLGTITLTANDSLFSEAQAGIPETVAGTGNLFAQASAGLAALASNGGTTQTRALVFGSPAINAGNNPAGLATDQRGAGFPRSVGADTDIGAFEFTAPQNIQVFDPSNTTQVPDGDVTPSVPEGTDFGASPIGTPVARTYVIRNTGDVALNISGISSTPGAFAVSGIPASVAPNATATFTVTFTPAAAGPATATISVLSNDPDTSEANYTFGVAGTGTATQNVQVFNAANTIQIADGDVTPSATDGTDFGATVVGTPVVRTFTIRNTGGQSLTISGISSDNAAFSVSNVPASVGAGATATFTVTMGAAAAGTPSATITVASNDPDPADASYTFSVQGTVGAPRNIALFDGTNTTPIADNDLTPSPADGTDFGNVTVGGTGASRSFTIRNSGSEPLLVSGIVSSNPSFTLSGVPASVAAGGTATFTINFNTGVTGLASATVTINTNDPDAADAAWAFGVQANGVPQAPPQVIPTLGEWAMGLLAALLVAFGLRRRTSTDELPRG